MHSISDLEGWMYDANELLSANRISLDGSRYTAPCLETGVSSRQEYANQFLLDSCFHAMVWRWFNLEMAQAELLGLVSRQVTAGPDAGMIPHCTYWHGGGQWLWNSPRKSNTALMSRRRLSMSQPGVGGSFAVTVC